MLRRCTRVVTVSGVGLAAARPNVLLIVSDDLRPEMGCYGGEALTPNIDALAHSNGAVLFERAYVQDAICCPTRSSFLTGRRPDTTRVWDLHTQFRDAPGAAEWKTLPQAFRDAGYTTSGMGKVFHPIAYKGKTDDIMGGSWSEPYFQPGPGPDSVHLSTTNCGVASDASDDSAYTDGQTAAHAVKVLRNVSARAEPFFVAVGFHRPHLPWVVPARYFEMYPPASIKLARNNTMPARYNATGAQQWSWDPQSGPRHCQPLYNLTRPLRLPEYGLVDNATALHFRRSYFAAVSFLDAQVGVVLDELAALGRADDTIVAFIGDHGWQLGDLGEFGKKTNFERATRTPFIIRSPLAKASAAERRAAAAREGASDAARVPAREAPPPAKSSALVEFVDLMPTLLDLALGAKPPLCPVNSSAVALCSEGKSLVAAMADPAASAGLYGAAFMQYASCMHDEGSQLGWHDSCNNGTEPHVMGYAMRTRRYRYIEWVRFNKSSSAPGGMMKWEQLFGSELYDHTAQDSVLNAAEAVNLAGDATHAAIVAALSKQLHAGWRASAAGGRGGRRA